MENNKYETIIRKRTKPSEEDRKRAKKYTETLKGLGTEYGTEVGKFSIHAVQRMRERDVSIEKVKETLKEAAIRYPGNERHKDAKCYQHDGVRIVMADDGTILTVIDLED